MKPRILLLGALAAVACALPCRAALGPGDNAAPLLSAPLGGKALPPTAGKVVLLDFWASWCHPCKASFPTYAKLASEYAPKGLVVVAVSVDTSAADYDSFLSRQAPPFFVARDSDHALVARVDVPTMPTCYLIDRTGRVRFVHAGFYGAESEKAERREIESLLAEAAP